MRVIHQVAACLAVMITVGQVQAGFISTVDQQNLGRTNSISSGGIYQTFVPTLTGIDSAEFELRFGHPDLIPQVSLRIYDGAGSIGALTLLAETESQAIDGNYAVFETYHFDFASTISLTPGNTYTLGLVNQGGDPGSLIIAGINQSNAYTSGMLVLSNGSPVFSSDNDLVFTEGLHASTVPEPASMALWGLGSLGMGGIVRRRRRKQMAV